MTLVFLDEISKKYGKRGIAKRIYDILQLKLRICTSFPENRKRSVNPEFPARLFLSLKYERVGFK